MRKSRKTEKFCYRIQREICEYIHLYGFLALTDAWQTWLRILKKHRQRNPSCELCFPMFSDFLTYKHLFFSAYERPNHELSTKHTLSKQ